MRCMALRFIGVSEEFRRNEREILRSRLHILASSVKYDGRLYLSSQIARNTIQFRK